MNLNDMNAVTAAKLAAVTDPNERMILNALSRHSLGKRSTFPPDEAADRARKLADEFARP